MFLFRLAADAVVLLHLAFVLFVLGGGLRVWRWPRWAWLFLPAVTWSALIEFTGWIGPLTPLGHHRRPAISQASYARGFIDHDLLALLYPVRLTQAWQWTLGAGVLIVDGAVYGILLWRWACSASGSE